MMLRLRGLRRRFHDRGDLVADPRRFAHPLLERLVPGQRDERGGKDDLEEEAHGGFGEVISYRVVGYFNFQQP